MTTVGIVFVIGALVVATYSGMLAARAARGRPIPVWRGVEGHRRPFIGVLLGAAAVVLAGIGSLFCLAHWGPASIFLTLLAFVPPLAVGVAHNRSLRAAE